MKFYDKVFSYRISTSLFSKQKLLYRESNRCHLTSVCSKKGLKIRLKIREVWPRLNRTLDEISVLKGGQLYFQEEIKSANSFELRASCYKFQVPR